MKVVYFSIVLFMSLALISCDKDDDKIDPERLITKAETANHSNEWDRTGQLHNDFLDFFINRDDFQDGVNRSYLLEITMEFYSRNELTFNHNEFIAVFDVFKEMEDSGLDIGSKQFSLPTICDFFPFYCELFPPSDPFPDLNLIFMTSGNNTDKVLDFIERTRRAENDIISSDTYSEEQKNVILESYAVARYSHQYWHNQEVLGNESPWDEYLIDDVIQASAGPIVRADIRGAIIGFFGGNPLGGAALASTAKAIDLFLDWLWDDDNP